MLRENYKSRGLSLRVGKLSEIHTTDKRQQCTIFIFQTEI